MGTCTVGVPKEVKPQEGRVGVTPDGVRALVALGIKICVEKDAGVLSGFPDSAYLAAGATIYHDTALLYRDADVIVKVKEPTKKEYKFLPLLNGKVLFTYLHLAGVDPKLTELLLEHRIIAIAYETVARVIEGQTTFPLLVPMSIIAGVQAMRGALLRHEKERYPGLRVVILGGGNVGEAALNQALVNKVGWVTVFELNEERRSKLEYKYRADTTVSFAPFSALDTWGKILLKNADIVISGVMLPGGAEAPKVLSSAHLQMMKYGAYIADVAIDQGGSTAWSKATKPGETFTRGKNKVVLSCVPNIPGSTVPKEATEALTKVTLPFVSLLAESIKKSGEAGLDQLLISNSELQGGLQVWHGMLMNSYVAEKHGLMKKYHSFASIFTA